METIQLNFRAAAAVAEKTLKPNTFMLTWLETHVKTFQSGK